MSKPIAERTHSSNVNRSRGGASASEIRQNKNSRAASRSAQRREAHIAADTERYAAWRALPPTKQLEVLDARHGPGPGQGAARQRARIARRMAT